MDRLFLLPLLLQLVVAQSPQLVFVGFRHGNRNPKKFLPDDPNKGQWGLEGEAQLTDVGKKQAYGLGKLLRKTYGSLLSDQWVPNEVLVGDLADTSIYVQLQWQMIPIEIDDQMLRISSTKCPASNNVWKPVDIGATEPGKSLLAKYKELIDYVAKMTGWAPTLFNMSVIAGNLEQIHSRHLKFPDWVTNNPFNKNIYRDVLQFSEVTEIGCADYEPCRKLNAGYWLNTVVEEMDKKHSDINYQKKMFLYGTHNEVASSFMQLLGVKQEGLPYNGAFFLEYADTPKRQIRMFYSTPKEDNPEERETTVVKLCPEGDWCPYELAANCTGLIPDWNVACGIDRVLSSLHPYHFN